MERATLWQNISMKNLFCKLQIPGDTQGFLLDINKPWALPHEFYQ